MAAPGSVPAEGCAVGPSRHECATWVRPGTRLRHGSVPAACCVWVRPGRGCAMGPSRHECCAMGPSRHEGCDMGPSRHEAAPWVRPGSVLRLGPSRQRVRHGSVPARGCAMGPSRQRAASGSVPAEGATWVRPGTRLRHGSVPAASLRPGSVPARGCAWVCPGNVSRVRVPSRHGLRLGLSRQRSKSGFRPGTGCAWVCPGNVQSPGSVPARVAPGSVPATFKVRVPSRHGLRLGLSRQRSKSGFRPGTGCAWVCPGNVQSPASPRQAEKSCVWVTSRRGRFASREQGMYSGAAPVAK